MQDKVTILALAGLLAIPAVQATATTITPTTQVETGDVSFSATGIPDPTFGDLSYTWSMFTEEGVPGTNSITFENTLGLPARATYTWNLLSTSDQDPTLSVLSVSNGGETVLAENTVGAADGPVQFTVANGAAISFLLSTDETASTPGAQAGGNVTFAPVPLPAGVVLLLTALGGLAVTRRLKKPAATA